MKILAIHAHPDDIEITCAGTLALLHQAGHDITLATMCNGDKGSPDKSQAEIAEIRKNEAERSAAILGVPYICLDYPDYELFDADRSRRKTVELLRFVNPEIIITASPFDYMADHIATSVIVRNASFAGGIPNYKTGEAPLMTQIPAIYYTDTLEGVDTFGVPLPPEFCVDISATIEMKESMLACHESQREWLRAYHGIDHYIISMKNWGEQRGRLIGVPFAEGFRQHKGHPYPKENLLHTLLASQVHTLANPA